MATRREEDAEKGPPGEALPTTLEVSAEPSGPRRGVVHVTSGASAGQIVRLSAGSAVTFGRSSECTVVLTDAGVSRVLAEIDLRGGHYVLRDHGSRNGTFLGDDRVELPVPLAHGDGIRLGSTVRLRFVMLEEAEERDLIRNADALPTEAARIGHATIDHATIDHATIDHDHAASVPSDGVVIDPAMRALYEQAARAARATISVLVLGETGAGKEVLAQAIHRASPRARQPFIALNCAALSESLLEAELFGHERGAFTGATHAREGLFEAADGGTVFLDEVGELPPSTQVKLLRVIEEKKVMRVGARAAKAVDVRFVSATNRDLEAEVEAGTFRADLFFRLNGIALTIPPLRARRGEIEELARTFIARASAEMGRTDVPSLSNEARDLLLRHAWPGNVRELRNAMERAVVLCSGTTLLPEHLPPRLTEPTVAPPAGSTGAIGSLRDHVSSAERQRVLDVLQRCGGNQTLAASELGVSRRTLVSRLSEWGMTRPRRTTR